MAAAAKSGGKASAKYTPVDLDDDDDDDDDDPPRPPPAGAPAWLATFADIATNLMAFFVLILGFAKFDEVSFKKMAGSMRETFGTEVIAPVFENMEGGTVLEMQFLPQGMPADQSESDEPPRGDDGQWQDRNDQTDDTPAPSRAEEKAAQAAAEALMEALTSGDIQVERGDETVTIKLPNTTSGPTSAEVAEALASLANTEATEALPPVDAQGSTAEETQGTSSALTEEQVQSEKPDRSPLLAAATLDVALEEQQARGLVEVERRDGSVRVTVGAGGAFASGDASLTPEALEILSKVSEYALSPSATLTVIGHTDDIPVTSEAYVDNLDLGAARAASVARALMLDGTIPEGQVNVVSKGEFAPIAENTTEEGRAKNRRVEIIIDY